MVTPLKFRSKDKTTIMRVDKGFKDLCKEISKREKVSLIKITKKFNEKFKGFL